MPRKKAPVQPRRQEIIDAIPTGAKRIKVRTPTGKVKFKPLDQVGKEDVILTKKDGVTPYTMMTEPGRPRKPDLSPANLVVAEILANKEKAMSEDTVLNTARHNPESADVLHQVMVGLADESASIAFERREAERKGEPTSQLSVRRVNALKSVADTWLRRKEQLSSNIVDMDSPGFQTLFKFIMETFKDALEQAEIHPEMIKVIFARFSKRIDSEEWRTEAKGRMRRNV
jgi:hypothetical protein